MPPLDIVEEASVSGTPTAAAEISIDAEEDVISIDGGSMMSGGDFDIAEEVSVSGTPTTAPAGLHTGAMSSSS